MAQTVTIDNGDSPYNITLIGADGDLILVDSTAGPVDIYLPNPVVNGRRHHIKDKYGTTDTNPITIYATPNLIDNVGTFVLTVERQSILAHSDSTNWWII